MSRLAGKSTLPFLAITLVAVLFGGVKAFPQQPVSPPPALATLPELAVAPPPPVTKANSPKPKPALKAVLDLFRKYEVVGMSAAHGEKDLDDFILALIRNPEFPNRVNDIAVECGNSRYQPLLDRYIAGEDVSLTEVRPVWRDTTQGEAFGLSSFCNDLFPLVRQINKMLPADRKLRVLAGDPPIDWSKIKTRGDLKKYGGGDRNKSIASVMEKEVLSKHRKALMLFGVFHLFHGMQGSAVEIYEKDYPNVSYIISEHGGFGRGVPSAAKYNDALEKRMALWPAPSLVNLKGTWLAEMDFAYFWPPLLMRQPNGEYRPGFPAGLSSISKAVDGFLYLGRSDLLMDEHMPASVFMDQEYIAELRRRGAIVNPGALDEALAEEKASGGG
jgi:hypothetical protein